MMTKADLIAYYGSQGKAARALGLAQPSISGWGEYPPPLRQLQIERATGGALKAEPGCVPLHDAQPGPEAVSC